jgi:hypothetical protein
MKRGQNNKAVVGTSLRAAPHRWRSTVPTCYMEHLLANRGAAFSACVALFEADYAMLFRINPNLTPSD